MFPAHLALARLRGLASDGTLDRFLIDRGVDLLVAFGSATVPDRPAADLDIGAALAPGADLYALVADLGELLAFDHVDVVDLSRADVVLKAEALAGVPLFESQPGLFARRQMAAITERMETTHLRRLDLELLSS